MSAEPDNTRVARAEDAANLIAKDWIEFVAEFCKRISSDDGGRSPCLGIGETSRVLEVWRAEYPDEDDVPIEGFMQIDPTMLQTRPITTPAVPTFRPGAGWAAVAAYSLLLAAWVARMITSSRGYELEREGWLSRIEDVIFGRMSAARRRSRSRDAKCCAIVAAKVSEYFDEFRLHEGQVSKRSLPGRDWVPRKTRNRKSKANA